MEQPKEKMKAHDTLNHGQRKAQEEMGSHRAAYPSLLESGLPTYSESLLHGFHVSFEEARASPEARVNPMLILLLLHPLLQFLNHPHPDRSNFQGTGESILITPRIQPRLILWIPSVPTCFISSVRLGVRASFHFSTKNMSTASEIPPTQPSAPVEFEPSRQTCFADVARDIIMWRRRLSSILVLTVATAIWAALQVYRFNFLTLASWVAMILVAFLFFWGNICRLLSKEAPDLSWMEMSESSAVEMANGIIEWTEEGVRWMFRVSSASSRREWLEVAATLASCWLLSLIGSRFDLHTILYAGLVVAMTVPSIYVKYEHKIKECGGRLRAQSQRFYGMAEEKLRVLKNRVAAAAAGKKKEKKTE